MFKRAGFISNVQSSHAIGHTDIQTSCRCFNGKHQKPITEMYTVVLGHQTYMNRQFIICKMRCLRRAAILTFFCSTELVKGNRRATELVKLEIPCRCLLLRGCECNLSCAMHLFQHELRKEGVLEVSPVFHHLFREYCCGLDFHFSEFSNKFIS